MSFGPIQLRIQQVVTMDSFPGSQPEREANRSNLVAKLLMRGTLSPLQLCLDSIFCFVVCCHSELNSDISREHNSFTLFARPLDYCN
jgi:hypothetical protein